MAYYQHCKSLYVCMYVCMYDGFTNSTVPPSPIRRRTMLAQLDELVDNLKAETDLGHTPRSPPPCTQLTSAPPDAFVTLPHHHDALPASKQVVSQLILELESGGNLRLEVLLWTHPLPPPHNIATHSYTRPLYACNAASFTATASPPHLVHTHLYLGRHEK